MGKRSRNTNESELVEPKLITDARKLNQRRRFYINPANGYIMDRGEIFCKIRECMEKDDFTENVCETLNAITGDGLDVKAYIDMLTYSEIGPVELEELINAFEKMKLIKDSIESLIDLSSNILHKHDDDNIEYDEDADINDLIFSVRMRAAEMEKLAENLNRVFQDFSIKEDKKPKKK